MRVTDRLSATRLDGGEDAIRTNTTDDDGVPSTNLVSEVRTEWQSDETSDGLDGVEETEGTSLGVPEVVFPGIEGPEGS